MSYVVERVSDSGAPLVSLDEAKEYLKVTHSLEDRIIHDMIERVINDMEGYMWASLQSSQYKLYVSDWLNGCIAIRPGPVSTIDTVEYYDSENALQTLSSSTYFLAKGVPDRLMREYNSTWPPKFRRPDAIIVTYSTNPVVSSKVKGRVLKALGYLYENRSTVDVSMSELYSSITRGARRNHL